MKFFFLLFITTVLTFNLFSQTLISQFDFLTDSLHHSTVGDSAVSFNKNDARLASGGGVYFVNSGGSTGIDLEIPRRNFTSIESVTFSFDYRRLESQATFFRMDDFRYYMSNGIIIIEYRVKDNNNVIVFNTNYAILMGQRVLLKVTYDASTGTMSLWENQDLKASNITTEGKSLDWPYTGNAFVGQEMDGSGSSTASLYQFQIYNVANSTLPVELTKFSVENINGLSKLKWITASESNNSHFEIQRSKDNYSFTTIGRVEGVGNSSVLNYYNFIDNDILNGTYYYRLKQVDFDNKFDYSESVAINVTENISKVNMYPNPVMRGELINFISEKKLMVHIFNSLGQEVNAYSFIGEYQLKSPQKQGNYFIIAYDEQGEKHFSQILIVK